MTQTNGSPAEAFPVWEFIKEALDAEGWTWEDLATQMSGGLEVNRLSLSLLLCVPDVEGLLLGEEEAADLGRIFGTSKQYWLNLDRSWQDYLKRRSDDHI